MRRRLFLHLPSGPLVGLGKRRRRADTLFFQLHHWGPSPPAIVMVFLPLFLSLCGHRREEDELHGVK